MKWKAVLKLHIWIIFKRFSEKSHIHIERHLSLKVVYNKKQLTDRL